MSYCRWSSDNWKCDLYCFADVSGGYTTHVASNRIVGEVPEAPIQLILDKKFEEWSEANKKQMAFLDTCQRREIGLPCDGESFNDETLELFLIRLIELRDMGYNFSDYVIESVIEEMNEEEEAVTK